MPEFTFHSRTNADLSPGRDDPLVSLDGADEPHEAAQPCAVAVIYDDRISRGRAMSVADWLTRKFLDEVEFEFSWWKFSFLADPQLSHRALEAAAEADVVVFCSHPGGDFPPTVKQWIDGWAGERANHEGLVIAMTAGEAGEQSVVPTLMHFYLREVAMRAGMDFLSDVSLGVSASGALPFSTETATRRANEVTSVLDQIRHYATPYPRWGLNE